MSKILKNNTASPQLVSDVGVTVAASSQYTIPAQDYLLWAASSNVITKIGDSTFTVNDGSVDLSISDGTDLIKGLWPKKVRLEGATDSTLIGNVGDAIKITGEIELQPSPGTIPSVGKKLRYADMRVAEGGVARNTSVTNAAWTQVFAFSGMGIMTSAMLNFEVKDDWLIRAVVDGEEVFGSAGLSTNDLISDSAYDLDAAGSPISPNEGNFGLSLEEHNRFVWVCPAGFPIRFETSVAWYARRAPGAAAKLIRGGLFILTKE